MQMDMYMHVQVCIYKRMRIYVSPYMYAYIDGPMYQCIWGVCIHVRRYEGTCEEVALYK